MDEQSQRAGREDHSPVVATHIGFLYLFPGGHARPIISDEAHDPLTKRGRRAICHLIAVAEYDRANFRSDIAHIRHCQARALYLNALPGAPTRHDLAEVLGRPPVTTVRSLLPDGWDEEAGPAARVSARPTDRRAAEENTRGKV